MFKDDIFNLIKINYSSFSKGQKKLADFISEHYDLAAFMTAAKLGSVAGVSESTAVRFATELGFKGYPEFREALEEVVMQRLSAVKRMEVSFGDKKIEELQRSIMLSDMEKIRQSIEFCDTNSFVAAVNMLCRARRVYIVGIRSCAPLASFLAFYMQQIRDEVHLVSTSNISEIFEQMIRMNEEDVVFGISFPRYSMRTLKAMEFANNRRAGIITLSDSRHSPVNLYSSCVLLAKSDIASIVDSLVAPLSLINALIAAMCNEKKDEVRQNLIEMERLWEEFQVYTRDDLQ